MATFSVPVVRIDAIEDHPNADALEIAKVRDFDCITRIGEYKAGDIAVYIPEAAVMPEWLLKRMGLWDEEKGKGKLAGKEGNRVKAVKLRGVVSQGLLYPVSWDDPDLSQGETVGLPRVDLSDGESYLLYDWNDVDIETIKSRCIDVDVGDVLGITKWEPPIPTHMAGEVCNIFGHTLKFDIENIQKHNEVLVSGEEVVITEKLHGTWTCFGFDPDLDHEELLHGGTIINSKGLSEQGLAFKWNDANDKNLYVRMFKQYMLDTGRWNKVMDMAVRRGEPVFILGETFGPGVQDLHYGLKEKSFLVFGIYVGKPGQGQYLDHVEFKQTCSWLEVSTVPVLYHGPFSMDTAKSFRDGKDTITGANIREGIVITPVKERNDFVLGRVTLKMISPDYLLRKGNATEFN